MTELARVVRPGGYILAEFYNRQSLRYLIKQFKPPSAISATRTDADVYTRYDDLASITSYLPSELRVVGIRGIRIATPTSYVHDIPGVGPMLRALESVLADTPGIRRLGGFLVIIARKR
jgi:hypothetical protein